MTVYGQIIYRLLLIVLATLEKNFIQELPNRKPTNFENGNFEEKLLKNEQQCQIYHPHLTQIERKRDFVFAGMKALPKEFPHMAILGYGDKNDVRWLCGGSLISENFVLTAAHCVNSLQGKVRWVRLGDLNINSTNDDAKPQDFAVDRYFIYPKYKFSSYYHDIALIKLNRKVEITEYVSPACLYTKCPVESRKFIATGWGTINTSGHTSPHLMKVNLDYINLKSCADSHTQVTKRKLKYGIVDKTQICAGDKNGKDTCMGDSGGPLQIKAKVGTFYYIVGITVFGKPCGFSNSVGVYTRVSAYIKWIENIVWP